MEEQSHYRLSNHELFSKYFTLISSELGKAFPCQFDLDLRPLHEPEPVFPEDARIDTYLSSGEKKSAKWRDKVEKQEAYKEAKEYAENSLNIVRGTVMFMLDSGLISSSEAQNFEKSKDLFLNKTKLTPKGYALLYRGADESVLKLLTGLPEKASASDLTHKAKAIDKQQGGFVDMLSVAKWVLHLVKETGTEIAARTLTEVIQKTLLGH